MNKTIKIADLFNTDYGAYRILRMRVKKIDSDPCFENYIICPKGPWSDKMKEQGIKIINYPLSNSLNPIKILKEVKGLTYIFQKVNPDIVHTHNSKIGAIGRIAAKKAGIKRIIHQVHGYHFTQYHGFKRIFYEKIEKSLAKYSDVLLFQNKNEYKYSLERNFKSNDKLIYIGNGISFDEFSEYLKNEKTFNIKKKKIICIARWQKVKNHKMLFEAIKILIEKYKFSNFKLYLYGEGSEKENLIKLSHRLNINNYIEFVGTLDRKEIIKEIFTADLSVLTSLKEGKPRALMESSLLGVPVIATNVIGTNEVVKHGKTGYLVELNNAEEFAKRMYDLLTNKEKWIEFSQNARKYAEKEFDENKIIDKLKKIYMKSVEV